MNRFRFLVSCLLSLVLPFALTAAPVTADAARRAVSSWTAKRPSAHMRARVNRPIKGVRTVRADGEEAFHVVDLEGGGFVVTAADDRIEPIIAFSGEGTLVEDPKNPLWVLLNLDLPQRMKAHKAGKVTNRDLSKMRGRGNRRRQWKEPSVEWRELTADDDTQQQESPQISSVSDVRVAALIQSKWSQSEVGSKRCYNYSTPNYYRCGCVATAGAQLMRYWQFPTKSVTAVTRSCWVDDVETDETMIGGTYDWANMPLTPASSSLTVAQQQAIGKLCYDAGVATRMDWTSDGSGACPAELAVAFVDVFGYANARCELTSSMTTAKTEDTIYANLDAGCPVLLGIHASKAGHEIVADGYGLENSVIYTHLNLGWSGSYDAWYALPSVSAGGYNFTTLSSVVYNVFPNKTGELITGRVLNENGKPIAGATVKAVNGSTTRTATANANGIYALNVTSAKTWALTATATGYVAQQTSVSVGTSNSSGYGPIEAGSYYYSNNGTVGNSWGNDITLEKAATFETLAHPAFVPYTAVARTASGTTAERVGSCFTNDNEVVYSLLTERGRAYALGLEGQPEGEWVTGDGTPQLLRAPKLANGTYQVLVKDAD